MTKTPISKLSTALALLAMSAALAACSPAGQTAAEHSSSDRAEGHTSSSAGLPPGHADVGEKLANTKNADTGQACVGCHGASGNAPLDPSYPKLGGQYYDYIAHSLQLYRDGERSGSPTTDLMGSQAKKLTDQQIADLAAYFGTQQAHVRDLHDVQ
jgi:cytochrome c553